MLVSKDASWCAQALPDDVAEPNTQVVARHSVHPCPLLPAGLIGQDDAHGLPPFSPFQHHGVPAEELQLFRLALKETRLRTNTHTQVCC